MAEQTDVADPDYFDGEEEPPTIDLPLFFAVLVGVLIVGWLASRLVG